MPKRETLGCEVAVVGVPVRLDQFLVQTWPGLDRNLVQQMVGSGSVSINGQPALKAGQRLEPGDQVVANVPEVFQPQQGYIVPPLPLSVLYEDEVVLVVEKLAGIMVQNNIPKVIIVRMTVPCCGGLTVMARQAHAASGRSDLVMEEVTIGLDGELMKSERIVG